jgi:hypothetical protein
MTKSSQHSRGTFSPQIENQIKDILVRAGNFKAEVETLLEPYGLHAPVATTVREKLENLLIRFHLVATQLQRRQRKKLPFSVEDEYDVQDLLHALLKIDFRDIRPEEYCPSYAGTSPRIDFFLPEHGIAVEAKMAREGHGNLKISNELIVDKEYYQKKPNVRILYCLVYDPNEIITNPDGFEDDLFERSNSFEAKILVIPKR